MAFRIAFASLKGGTGRTTLTANVAAQLARSGTTSVAIDLDPQNSLGLHLGMHTAANASGFVQSAVLSNTEHLCTPVEKGLALVPFGSASDQHLLKLENSLRHGVEWLSLRLDMVTPDDTEMVLIDTPASRSPWLSRTLSVADLVLVPLLPDAASYATLPLFEKFVQESASACANRVYYLINQYQPRYALARDVLESLRALVPERVVPFVLQHDELAREQLANCQPIPAGNISQIGLDLQKLAHWILEKCADQRQTMGSLDAFLNEPTGAVES